MCLENTFSSMRGQITTCRIRHCTISVDCRFAARASLQSSDDCDVVVIGSGIGGLSCAAMMANYGLKVHVTLDIPKCIFGMLRLREGIWRRIKGKRVVHDIAGICTLSLGQTIVMGRVHSITENR